MSCSGACNREHKVGIRANQGYAKGYKKCRRCRVWMSWEGKYCPCCNQVLSWQPKSRKGKEKYRETNPIKRIET